MIQILYTDTPYMIVQHFPKKVVFRKTDSFNISSKDFLNKYMEKRGYHEIENQQMGLTLVYSNGYQIEKINFTINGYYSKWEWY